MDMMLTSPAFEHRAEIPSKYTCEGQDISPPLSWSGVPAGAKSLALIVEDPDAPDPAAPQRTWTHWVLYDIPPDSGGLPEGAAASHGQLPQGTRQGSNDWHRADYGGPCPPIGRHRYFFKLYALNAVLPDLHKPGRTQLLSEIRDKIIGQAELVGVYRKH